MSRGLSGEGIYEDVLNRIEDWEDKYMVPLALVRLRKAYSAQGDTDLLEGGIVCLILGTRDKKARTIQVMDYQGHTGRDRQADCKSVGVQSVDRDDTPFGLHLDSSQLRENLGGGPYDLDVNPAIKKEDPMAKKKA